MFECAAVAGVWEQGEAGEEVGGCLKSSSGVWVNVILIYSILEDRMGEGRGMGKGGGGVLFI